MKVLKRIIILSIVVSLLTLTGCSSGSSASNGRLQNSQTGTTANAVLSGTTKDNTFSITLTTINVTTTTNAQTGTVTDVTGTFELKNLTDSPIPTASVYFGVLDKKTNFTYWGSVQINALESIDPHANVQGAFAAQFPSGVDPNNCNIVFGPLPKITFEAPIPIEK